MFLRVICDVASLQISRTLFCHFFFRTKARIQQKERKRTVFGCVQLRFRNLSDFVHLLSLEKSVNLRLNFNLLNRTLQFYLFLQISATSPHCSINKDISELHKSGLLLGF